MALNPAIADCRLQGTATSPPSTTKFSMNFSIIQFNNKLAGGAEGDRTLDLSIANAALSQLSYGPKNIIEFRSFIERIPKRTENTCKKLLPFKN